MWKRHSIERKAGVLNETGEIKTGINLDDYPKVKSIKKQFGMLHGISTLLNLFALCFGIVHFWNLTVLMIK